MFRLIKVFPKYKDVKVTDVLGDVFLMECLLADTFISFLWVSGDWLAVEGEGKPTVIWKNLNWSGCDYAGVLGRAINLPCFLRCITPPYWQWSQYLRRSDVEYCSETPEVSRVRWIHGGLVFLCVQWSDLGPQSDFHRDDPSQESNGIVCSNSVFPLKPWKCHKSLELHPKKLTFFFSFNCFFQETISRAMRWWAGWTVAES